MKDRLSDLLPTRTEAVPSLPDDSEEHDGLESVGFSRAKMEAFYDKIVQIEKSIGFIPTATKEIQKIIDTDLARGLSWEEEKGRHNQACDIMTTADKHGAVIRATLQFIQQEAKRAKNCLGDKDSSYALILEFLSLALAEQLSEELRIYENALRDYKAHVKLKLRRHISCVNPYATDEDIERMILSGWDRDTSFEKLILWDSGAPKKDVPTIPKVIVTLSHKDTQTEILERKMITEALHKHRVTPYTSNRQMKRGSSGEQQCFIYPRTSVAMRRRRLSTMASSSLNAPNNLRDALRRRRLCLISGIDPPSMDNNVPP